MGEKTMWPDPLHEIDGGEGIHEEGRQQEHKQHPVLLEQRVFAGVEIDF